MLAVQFDRALFETNVGLFGNKTANLIELSKITDELTNRMRKVTT